MLRIALFTTLAMAACGIIFSGVFIVTSQIHDPITAIGVGYV